MRIVVLVKYFYGILFFLLSSTTLLAETYIREYTYKASEADSKLSSRTIALDQVKTLLLQEIGTHIRQELTITKDSLGGTYASEDVEAVTAGLTKVEILEEKWNGITYYLKAKIDADTQQVLNALEEFKNANSEKKQQLEALKKNQAALKQLREEISQLILKLKIAKTEGLEEKVNARYIEQVKKLSMPDIYIKGYETEEIKLELEKKELLDNNAGEARAIILTCMAELKNELRDTWFGKPHVLPISGTIDGSTITATAQSYKLKKSVNNLSYVRKAKDNTKTCQTDKNVNLIRMTLTFNTRENNGRRKGFRYAAQREKVIHY